MNRFKNEPNKRGFRKKRSQANLVSSTAGQELQYGKLLCSKQATTEVLNAFMRLLKY
jgi:hypothetical protein